MAEQELKIRNIYECCKGKKQNVGGYIWRYAKEDERMLKGLEIT